MNSKQQDIWARIFLIIAFATLGLWAVVRYFQPR